MSPSTEGPAPAAHGLVLGERVTVGEGVLFGAYVVVHDGTSIGEGAAIGDHAVLGRRPRLSSHSRARGAVGALHVGAEEDLDY